METPIPQSLDIASSFLVGFWAANPDRTTVIVASLPLWKAIDDRITDLIPMKGSLVFKDNLISFNLHGERPSFVLISPELTALDVDKVIGLKNLRVVFAYGPDVDYAIAVKLRSNFITNPVYIEVATHEGRV